jgi:alkylhydroperoxidase family enzyme
LVRKGLTEAEAEAAAGDLAHADLPPATVAALKLADALTEHGLPEVSPMLMDELLEHFDHGQILELGFALSVASGWQRMIEAFGIRPDYWTDATPAPRRPQN